MGEVNFKRQNIYVPPGKHQFFFDIFRNIPRFLKVEATFPYNGNAFFNIYFIRLVKTDFMSSENSVFWSGLFFCEWKPLLDLGEKQFSKKELIISIGQLILWLVETNFSLFFSDPSSFFYVCLKQCFKKSFIPASGNGF